MNRNLIIVLAGGFLIAVLVAFLVQASLSGKKAEVVEEAPRVEIIVAASDLEIGDELDEENIQWQEWPANGVFPGAIVREENKKPLEMVEGRARVALKTGEPITEMILISKDKGNLVAATLQEGMRAVAVEVSAVQMAGGFIGPGDYVDVMLVYKDSVRYDGPANPQIDDYLELNLQSLATETILQNVKVLGVDQSPRRDEEKEGGKVGKTVTLEVNLQDAEVLALAGEMGDLTLALRRLGDDKIYEKSQMVLTDKRLTHITDELYKSVLYLQNNSGQNTNIVRIYNGYALNETAVRP